MKRSEMLKILNNSFWFHMNCDCCYSDELMYSAILKDLENAGMLPPTDTKVLYGTIFEPKWDSEDE